MAMHRAMGGQTVNVYGNPDLKPEKSTSWDISLDVYKRQSMYSLLDMIYLIIITLILLVISRHQLKNYNE